MSPPSLPKAGTGEWKGRSCTNYTFKTIKMPHMHATTSAPRRRPTCMQPLVRRGGGSGAPTCMQPLDRRGGGGAPPVRIHAPPNLLYVHVLTISQSFAITMEMQKTHEGYRYRMDR